MAEIKSGLPEYPIKKTFPEIKSLLNKRHALALEAPTGSGKTTLLPILMLQSGLSRKKIMLTQPRRLAAKTVAERISRLLGSPLGEIAGYRIKGESKISEATVIEVVTEGYALTLLQTDPFLTDYDWMIIDEFHERHIETDLLTAFLRDMRNSLGQKNSPGAILMTATWQGQPRENLSEFDFFSVEGRLFPVERIFYSGPEHNNFNQRLCRTVSTAVKETTGKILVFLPGRKELEEGRLLLKNFHPDAEIVLLHGGQDLRNQESVLQYTGNSRQIILSTSIAETSLTIEGVTAVVDSGLERLPVYHPGPGLNRLVTRRLSRATSDQRAGRAGRLGPGKYYCLWTDIEDREIVERWDPEILCGDLARARLQAALWGEPGLPWITAPPEGLWSKAKELLCSLNALDNGGKITEHGKLIAGLPLHPRLGHMVTQVSDQSKASLIAAILTEGYRFRFNGISLTDKINEVQNEKRFQTIGHEAFEITRKVSRTYSISNRINCSPGGMLSLAYPDRIGNKTTAGEYKLLTGAGLRCRESSAEWAVFPEISGSADRLIGRMPEQMSIDEIRFLHPGLIETKRDISYIPDSGRFKLIQREMLGKIVLKELPADEITSDERVKALKKAVKKHGFEALPIDNRIKKHLARLKLLSSAGIKDLPEAETQKVADSIDEWLAPWLDGDLNSEKIFHALENRLDWSQKKRLNDLLPSKFEIRPGHFKTIDYSNPQIPLIRGRLQEFYGLSVPLRIAEGQITLSIEMLSPAMRPLQTTSDIASFWSGSYQQIRSEMRGRYPKHFWPEDPAHAEPSLATGKKRPE